MWEAMTYENIMNDMLDRVNSDVDKREGSVIYDALAPCAYHLAQTYFYLDSFVDLVSGDTAVGEYLDKVVADYGITRKAATYAVRQITTTGAVSIGTRWGVSDTSYMITALLSNNVYSAICEQEGKVGNIYSGTLENIDNVSGITATLASIITAGEEEETDDDLRTRFYAQVRSTGTSGNKHDYRNWALEVPGCGDAKVYPTWNGSGTVKVLVVDEDMAIDPSLPAKVADYIESVRPIGATVTVESPNSIEIDITANVKLDGTGTLEEVKAAFTASLMDYLKETVFDVYNLSYARIGSMLLATTGVQDYNTLQVNGSTANIVIGSNEMPICGSVTLTEV
jgi:uncharacterized phage protein gp47/JayE